MSQDLFDFIKASETTPMMKQYLNVKSQYKDSILFYRMGDFYEMFFEDAIEASKILNIALTKRGKYDDKDIPMCGVPFHSSENYLHKLIEYGYKVAICEQMESPEEAKKRGHKSVVRREVIRVITPGTIIEDSLLDGKSSNYLVSISNANSNLSIAWVDISTGEFFTINTILENIASDLARLSPKEILISDKLYNDDNFIKNLQDYKKIMTTHVASFFDVVRCENKIRQFYNVMTIESFGDLLKSQISACGSILEYLSITQKNNQLKLKLPKIVRNELFMQIDYATRRNLELVSNFSGDKKNTVLNVIDSTKTNMGGRLINHYISSPLVDIYAINSRLDIIEFFFNHPKITENLREILSKIPDLERAISRLQSGYGGPRDLLAIKNALIYSMHIVELIEFGTNNLPKLIKANIDYLCGFDSLISLLERSIKEEVPILARDGGFVKKDFHPKLEELHKIDENSKNCLNDLKEKYSQQTGIVNLKIIKNNILGYFIEITPQQNSKISNEDFIHRQTLTTGIRYTTIELKNLESQIINSKSNILKLELEIFEEIKQIITNYFEQILLAANALAILDVGSSLAFVSIKNNYVRPLIDDSTKFDIRAGRHIVVEQSLKDQFNEEFIPNDCLLEDNQKISLLTGPNMAGKSTYLRQNAIIVILAQIGCFVPADYVHIGVVDRVFSRVGAADDLAKGRSTFMVEMVETATILNQATDKSLVILDEIGRGTSTYDGLSIAWSCLEYLHNKINARAIFATHYHELTILENQLQNLKCSSVAVKEWQGKVVFLHQVISGAADKSYGIHVAKIAGVPNSVIKRANQILEIFEKKSLNSSVEYEILPENFDNLENDSKIVTYLKSIDINKISPIEAINHIYELKKLIE